MNDREIVRLLQQQSIILGGILLALENSAYTTQDTLKALEFIIDVITPRLARIQIDIGEPVPVTLAVGQKTTATVVGIDQFGNPFPIDFTANPVTFVDSAETVASDSPTPASGSDVVTGVAAGSMSLSATIPSLVNSATGQPFTVTDTVTVTPPPAVLTSVALQFSPPA